jgi:tripartite-type tricarboxylate transporter receptor subunit TctC
MITRRKLLQAATGFGISSLLLPGWAKPANYPTQPIKVIVPFAAGGGGDLVARVMAQALAEQIGSPTVVENKPGAGGVLGSNVALKSPADGYTLLNMSNSYAIQAAVTKLPFDPIADLQPIIMAARTPNVLMVNVNSPFKSAQDLLAAAKKDPDKYTHGSAGVGSIAHLGMEELSYVMGVKLVHVPYKGSSQAMNDLLGGNVDLVLSSTTFSTPYINSGRVRCLGIAGPVRVATLPNVQTFEEQGILGFNTSDWKAWGAPKGVPPAIVSYLNEELNKVLKTKSIVDRLNQEGTFVVGGSAEHMMDLVQTEIANWKKFVALANIKIE